MTAGVSGCAQVQPEVRIGCADPPQLTPMTQDMRNRTDADVLLWFEDVFGEARRYGRENCQRILAHDGVLQ